MIEVLAHPACGRQKRDVVGQKYNCNAILLSSLNSIILTITGGSKMIAIDILKPVGTGTGAHEACTSVNTRSHASREHACASGALAD
jgi:hypothetical protein